MPGVRSGPGVIRALLSSRPAPVPAGGPPNPRRSTILDDRRPPDPDPEPTPKPPGLFASIRNTRASAMRLALAHLDLAKAEASRIKGEIGKVAAFVGIAFAVGLLAIILLFVG